MFGVNKEIEVAVNDDAFGLDGEEQIVLILKKINKNQERLIDLMLEVSEMLKKYCG